VFFSVLGKGTFGIVFKAFDRVSQSYVAIKQVAKSNRNVSREYKILKNVENCENCITLLDIFYSHTSQLCEFLVLEYLPYNLKDFIYRSSDPPDPLKIKFIFKELIKGLQQLHSHSIIHRDLKPENILLDSISDPKIVKIIDFGSAKQCFESLKNSYVVSSYYRAPELLFASRDYSTAIDVWAAGCILAEMFLKRPLFYCCYETELFALQVKELGRPKEEVVEYFSQQAEVGAKDLIRAVELLSKRFENRENRVLNSEVICRSFYKVIKKLLTWDHRKRPDALSILNYKLLH
jgi:serine/threonine protein kinase